MYYFKVDNLESFINVKMLILKKMDENIIGFSAGIGKTTKEAEAALREAKAGNKNNLYNYVMYDETMGGDLEGEVCDGELFLDAVISYENVLNFLRDNNAEDSLYKNLDTLITDPRTGLLTQTGYQINMAKIKAQGVEDGFYIFLDGNDMKRHNTEQGYSAVNSLLGAAGRAILDDNIREVVGEALIKATRSLDRRNSVDRRSRESDNGRRETKKDRRDSDLLDLVCHRVHDSGGDEFLVYLPFKEIPKGFKVENVAERILNNIYEARQKLSYD